ncbi:MAG: TonB-dependent receptor plug domain-containing protein [Puniceicoccaceae bacterium]
MLAPWTLNAQDSESQDDLDIFELSPFVVDSTKDTRYAATNTLAATRVRTELDDVASAVSVYTEDFLDDLAATDDASLLLYATNAEVGGVGGNFAGAGGGGFLDENDGLGALSTTTRVRGLDAADNTRDYIRTLIPWDGYNVDRVDMQRGPNSVLYGLGKPAGIINTTTKQAFFGDLNELSFQVSNWGSFRATGDFNKEIIENQLAIRLNVLSESTEFRQKPAYEDDQRINVVAKYLPEFLNGEKVRTKITIGYEDGSIDSNKPRSLPPIDLITPWFTEMGKEGIHPINKYDTSMGDTPGFGQAVAGHPNYQPWVGVFGAVYEGMAFFFDDPSSSSWSSTIPGAFPTQLGLGPDGQVDLSIEGVPQNRHSGVSDYPAYALAVGLPFSNFGQYKNRNLTDPTVFDFYNNLLDGPNKYANADFDAFNIKLEETFFDDKLGFEVVYDRQNVWDEQLTLLSDVRQAVHIDINSHLLDGSVNPNFGRPFTSDTSSYGNRESERTDETFRFTGFATLDLTGGSQNWFRKLLGKHNFTGLVTESKSDGYTKGFLRYAMSEAFGDAIGVPNLNSSGRSVNPILYLGPSLAGQSTASGANIQGLKAIQAPSSGAITWWNPTWADGSVDPGAPWTEIGEYTQSENPANYVGWTTSNFNVLDASAGDRDALTNDLSVFKETVTSKAIVWQGYFLDNAIIPMFGYREDVQKTRSGNAARNALGQADLGTSPDDFEEKRAEGEGLETYGLVVHVNRLLPTDFLPLNLSLKWGESENFDPSAERIDMLGNPLPSPSGKTEDYGFTLATKDGRYRLSFTKYKTEVKDATNNIMNNSLWGVGFIENWAYARATVFNLDQANPWEHDYTPIGGQTPEEAAAAEAAEVGAYLANLPPQEFFDLWNINTDPQSLNQQGLTYTWTAVTPNGLAATNDTVSKGIEIELAARPIDNLDIILNISKTEAFRDNVGGSIGEFIADRLDVMNNTPAGNMRFWWAGDTSTYKGNAAWAYLADYELLRLGQGAAVPEIRKWRANLVANYSITDGRLAGMFMGTSVRWQDKITLGYDAINGPDGVTFDFDNPHYGPSETNVDFWIGYNTKLTDSIDWKIQLNVRNAFSGKDLIPVTVNPGGAPAGYRIAPERTWFITNTFTF